jgi:hypothetical protein
MSVLETLLGGTLGSFLGLTVVLSGGAAAIAGQALARNWRPIRQLVPYALLLAAGDRFLVFALFDGELLSISGYVIAAAVDVACTLVSYRLTAVQRMVEQYPWLYERAGPFEWRERR